MRYIESIYSKNQINKAGKAVRAGNQTQEQEAAIENFRASHAYLLNTFNSNLRGRCKGTNYIVGQRLKRRVTIYDKLSRQNGMELARMHDIAGLRVIFPSIENLNGFRDSLHAARFNHELVSKGEFGHKYDYIQNPQPSGYRGIHDVYRYKVNSVEGRKWNGLLLEIQFRTEYQHAWATAVEVVDLIKKQRIKFSDSKDDYLLYFKLSSEILARAFENMNSSTPQMTNGLLVKEFLALDDKLRLLHTLNAQTTDSLHISEKKHTILIHHFGDLFSNPRVEIESFERFPDAIKRYTVLENDLIGLADIVLVRADNIEEVKNVFRNYFSDAKNFLEYIDEGCSILSKRDSLCI